MLGSLKLAASTFIDQEKKNHVGNIHYDMESWSERIDIFFNIIYLFEFLIKSITMGFTLDANSYLSISWNKLDFIIVLASL